MIRRFKRLNNSGDTIVEVMIVLAVLGLALSIAYATANRGLQQSRNAQEHSQALGIINSQVEMLRSAFAKKAGAAIEAQAGTGPFCLAPSGTAVSITPLASSGVNKFDEDIANDKLGNTATYPGPCIQDTFYNTSIVGRGDGVYDFRVRWQGVGQLGRQQEELTYKIGDVIAAPSGGYTDEEVPPPPPLSGVLSVIVQSIPLTGPAGTATNPTPSCSSAGTNKSGTTVSINGPTGITNKTTDTVSTATFGGLQQGSTYNISVSRAGYGVCPSGANSAVASTSTPVPTVTKKIYPICQPHTTTTYSGYWAYGNRRADLDGYYYTIPPAVANGTYPGAYDRFVVGNYRAAGNFWYIWSGDGSRGGEGLLYYWLYEAYWVNTTSTTTTYSCPS